MHPQAKLAVGGTNPQCRQFACPRLAYAFRTLSVIDVKSGCVTGFSCLGIASSLLKLNSGTIAFGPLCHSALGFAIDYPAAWDVDGVQGAFVWLSNPAMSDEERQAINIAVLAEPSLEAMLDNVERGSFGPYMISAEPIQLGELEALKVTLRQAPEGLSLLWQVIPAKLAARPRIDYRCLRRPRPGRGHRRHLAAHLTGRSS